MMNMAGDGRGCDVYTGSVEIVTVLDISKSFNLRPTSTAVQRRSILAARH